MTTFVLVHGGWSGAHGWRRVRQMLADQRHQVFTPSLTGIGERVHLVSPQVSLTTHIHDVVNQVLYEDLSDIALVGYSYGGAVVTGCLDHIGNRVRELVYLDAFVPADGDTVAALSRRDRTATLQLGDEWLVPPPERSYDDPAEGRWQAERRVPHPLACFTEAVRLSTPLEQWDFGLTYIKATADGPDAPGGKAFWDAAAHAKGSDRWRYHEIDCNHMVASNRPAELVEILTSLERSGGDGT